MHNIYFSQRCKGPSTFLHSHTSKPCSNFSDWALKQTLTGQGSDTVRLKSVRIKIHLKKINCFQGPLLTQLFVFWTILDYTAIITNWTDNTLYLIRNVQLPQILILIKVTHALMFSDGNILQHIINLDWNLSFTARLLVSPEHELNIFQNSCWAPASIHEPY